MRARISVDCSLRTGTVVAVQKTERGRCSEEYVSTKEAIKCRHTRIASVCFLLVFQKEGGIDLASERASRYFSSCLLFRFFVGSSKQSEKSRPYI